MTEDERKKKNCEYTRKYNRAHPDVRRANRHRWATKNKEKLIAQRQARYNTPKGTYLALASLVRNGKRKWPLVISLDEFVTWYTKTPHICFYCDIPENLAKKIEIFSRHGQFGRLSIDRVNSKLGYEAGNLVLACYLCNAIKQNVLSASEMREIGQRFIKPKWQQHDTQ